MHKRYEERRIKENLETLWLLMILLFSVLVSALGAIVATRAHLGTLSGVLGAPRALDLHWIIGLPVVALIVIPFAQKLQPRSPFPVLLFGHRRVTANQVADVLLILNAVLLPASGAAMTVWSGQNVELSGLLLIAAGPKHEDLHLLSFLVHLFSALLLASSIAGQLFLTITQRADRKVVTRATASDQAFQGDRFLRRRKW